MATTATGSQISGTEISMSGKTAIYVMTLDTTDASGFLTWDLTADFSKIFGVKVLGSTAPTGYVVEIGKLAYTADVTATGTVIGIFEAGADAAPLDPVASTDVSTYIPGLTLEVTGLPA